MLKNSEKSQKNSKNYFKIPTGSGNCRKCEIKYRKIFLNSRKFPKFPKKFLKLPENSKNSRNPPKIPNYFRNPTKHY
jgi:hypothetical protein